MVIIHREQYFLKWPSVECGVPQGSVLGPLFFLVYVNDMARACRGLDLVLFADDTNIFAQGKDPAELFGRVNRGLGELSRWFRCNRPPGG